MSKQNRLLLIENKTVQARDGMLQKAECRAFQVEKLAAILADEVHFRLAGTRTRVTVLKFLVLFGAHDLYDA